jgi:hypothetical protein
MKAATSEQPTTQPPSQESRKSKSNLPTDFIQAVYDFEHFTVMPVEQEFIHMTALFNQASYGDCNERAYTFYIFCSILLDLLP